MSHGNRSKKGPEGVRRGQGTGAAAAIGDVDATGPAGPARGPHLAVLEELTRQVVEKLGPRGVPAHVAAVQPPVPIA